MSKPIGKGSRFRVLTGDYRGREGTIACTILGSADVWILNLGEGLAIDFTQVDADSPHYQRLSDAPPVADPLLAEIDAAARKVDLEAIGQVGGIVDAIRNNLDDGEDTESEADWFASRRLIFADTAALCLAGMRKIDAMGKVAP